MEGSVLGEVGNITAASFLNAVADACRLVLHPSPPTVRETIRGSLLSTVVGGTTIEAPQALLLHTKIYLEADELQGDLLLVPSATACAVFESRLVESQR
jgi:chemotaxis protein CheY-P-specific phosphatase CheC